MCYSLKSCVGRVTFSLVAVAIGAASARAETSKATLASQVDSAMEAVFNGPEKKKLKVNGHRFNVKPAKTYRIGPFYYIEGQISHHLSRRFDDQVYYKIKKRGSRVLSIKVTKDRGGAAPFVAKFISAASTYLFGKPLPVGKLESLGRKLGELVDGKWDNTAEMLVAQIAIRADEMGRDQIKLARNAGLKRPPVAPRPSKPSSVRRPAGRNGVVRDNRTR